MFVDHPCGDDPGPVMSMSLREKVLWNHMTKIIVNEEGIWITTSWINQKRRLYKSSIIQPLSTCPEKENTQWIQQIGFWSLRISSDMLVPKKSTISKPLILPTEFELQNFHRQILSNPQPSNITCVSRTQNKIKIWHFHDYGIVLHPESLRNYSKINYRIKVCRN